MELDQDINYMGVSNHLVRKYMTVDTNYLPEQVQHQGHAGLLGAIGVGAQAIAQAPAAMNAVKSKFPKMSKPQFPYDKIDKTGYGIMPPKNMKSDFSYEHPEHRGYANRYFDQL